MLRPFIDAHVHLNTNTKAKLKLAKEYDAYFISINTDIPFFISLDKQESLIHELNQIENRSFFITSFDIEYWDTEKWIPHALNRIKQGISRGAKGVKIWKNIGMDSRVKDRAGNFVLLDDPRFDPIFQYLSDHNILLINHQGEPRNCWLPLEEMTVDSDRDYFSEHPEYHMYKNQDYPSYEEHIKARDNVLQRYPNLNYVGLHLFSMEWSLDEVAKRLEQFPNSKTDLAERICHVQLQTIENREKVRDFFIKYQDRIIYGTDVIDDGSMNAEEVAAKFQHLWNYHWTYFSTDSWMKAAEFEGTFQGLKLPEEVLYKIFFQNAVETYNLNFPVN
ncbi:MULTISPECIES: amidohydrolase family protein [unclassified Leeuwenhoekiella]|uniref:amidohydrolase family protein n=1 Tax=unclassified Leeuwenhoekiella TaxID=2615029 RepID=UPI000C0D0317|nr:MULTISPECIES: amidohydrolase family protein [unclassified Leeuwenhoekiella]MAS71528.1 hydrolase [Zunongwangia sp.]MAW96267.1 hydrolase [Leeuwenhoekiella sp.]MBA82758.1 hydrolase [Leeuwenhoekiella sp.]PHR95487.1 MAG: hydrolase [Leeuwenhoekiella sp.]|tara:strand:+ start:18835 stop:19833 length:999 start_codon:yes stop_codon:yes gene_type:complete